MSMNVNEINDAWVAQGQKVSDLQAKMNAAALSDDFKAEDYEKLADETKNAEAKRDALKDSLDNARAALKIEMDNKNPKKLPKNDDNKAKFADNLKKFLKGDIRIADQIDSGTNGGSNYGLTIPIDQQTAINQLVRQYDSLVPLVKVESVNTNSGSRVYEKWGDIQPMASVKEGALIPNMDVSGLRSVEYNIVKYAGIIGLTNELLNDSAENIEAYLNTQIARKVVVTRNAGIINAIGKIPAKADLANFDAINTAMNTEVDPAIANTSRIITNQSGLNILSNVKLTNGQYLVQPVVTNPIQKQISGHPIVEISDKWLPDNNGSHPFIFGDLAQAITLFDRQNMSILSTNTSDTAFSNDLTLTRVIDRFDVEGTDTDAITVHSFKTLPDQMVTVSGANVKSGK